MECCPHRWHVQEAGAGPLALLLHGAADRVVGPRNSVALAERLRAAGARAEARLYPAVGHVGLLLALARPFRGRAPALRDLLGFAAAAAG